MLIARFPNLFCKDVAARWPGFSSESPTSPEVCPVLGTPGWLVTLDAEFTHSWSRKAKTPSRSFKHKEV